MSRRFSILPLVRPRTQPRPAIQCQYRFSTVSMRRLEISKEPSSSPLPPPLEPTRKINSSRPSKLERQELWVTKAISSESAPPSESTSSAKSTAPEDGPSPSTSHSIPPPTQKLLYHVSRIAKSKDLPIYTDIKAGKTLKQTRIRKITGDLQQLRHDLIVDLRLHPDRESCEINALTGHIIIKGWHKPRVTKFLEDKGF